jgi:hypothetical protein
VLEFITTSHAGHLRVLHEPSTSLVHAPKTAVVKTVISNILLTDPGPGHLEDEEIILHGINQGPSQLVNQRAQRQTLVSKPRFETFGLPLQGLGPLGTQLLGHTSICGDPAEYRVGSSTSDSPPSSGATTSICALALAPCSLTAGDEFPTLKVSIAAPMQLDCDRVEGAQL